ncbi:VCBS repeat-containing protein [Bacteroidota bacterium]
MNKYIWIALLAFTIACTRKNNTLFKKHGSVNTGIEFVNWIDNSDTLNILNYIYYFDGGGVGVADFNNDGLIDIFFAGNRVEDALYFNNGDWKFTDVTKQAGINKNGWSTGISVVDINTDGWLDIYVGRAGFASASLRENVLYVNQKNGTFIEQAEKHGINHRGYTKHSAFFDYDLDGDLDLYVMNHANNRSRVNTPIPLVINDYSPSSDRLFENENGVFVDVSRQSGILAEGYGLGLAINDFNHDGWPDIYVSNDFIFSDLLFINNQNGTFTESADVYIAHQSYNSMGTDVGDINNDGRMDLITLDMMPEDNYRQKTMMGSMNYNKFQLIISSGYAKQYMRNMLQVDIGHGIYCEIGRLSGISMTDWSWAPLLADFDNDGMNDLFISNGYYRDITDKDFLAYSHSLSLFKSGADADSAVLGALETLREVKLANYAFRNTGNFKMKNVTDSWLGLTPTLSNGAIYADFDNDGDLDLVTNNMNEEAGIYENTTDENKRHYVRIRLNDNNATSTGSQVKVYAGKDIFVRNWSPYKGYLCSTYDAIHIGVGQNSLIDSLIIYWAQGSISTLLNLKVDTLYQIDKPRETYLLKPERSPVSEILIPGLSFEHKEDLHDDFEIQPLVPRLLSREGPALAIGDLNGDQLEDVYVGGAYGQSGVVFFQFETGFRGWKLPGSDDFEDVDAEIFDANNDGMGDLYIVSGGNDRQKQYQDRLYINHGNGVLKYAQEWLPRVESNGNTVSSNDFDKDGDIDLFVGAGNTPGEYPLCDSSYVLINEGERFIISDSDKSWTFKLGLVSDSKWADMNSDGWSDLIIAGTWMPISIVYNDHGNLSIPVIIPHSEGWWNSLEVTDLDNDGDPDIVVGNFGTNNEYKANTNRPVTIIAKDFDNNGSIDPIICRYFDDISFPVAMRDAMLRQIPNLQGRLPKYAMYAQSTLEDIFTEKELENVITLTSREFRSGVFENTDSGFIFKPFPVFAQFGPVKSILCEDLDGDSIDEIIIVGNDHGIEVLSGQQDALPGLILTKNKRGSYSVVRSFRAENARKIRKLIYDDQSFWLVAQNDSSLKILKE